MENPKEVTKRSVVRRMGQPLRVWKLTHPDGAVARTMVTPMVFANMPRVVLHGWVMTRVVDTMSRNFLQRCMYRTFLSYINLLLRNHERNENVVCPAIILHGMMLIRQSRLNGSPTRDQITQDVTRQITSLKSNTSRFRKWYTDTCLRLGKSSVVGVIGLMAIATETIALLRSHCPPEAVDMLCSELFIPKHNITYYHARMWEQLGTLGSYLQAIVQITVPADHTCMTGCGTNTESTQAATNGGAAGCVSA